MVDAAAPWSWSDWVKDAAGWRLDLADSAAYLRGESAAADLLLRGLSERKGGHGNRNGRE